MYLSVVIPTYNRSNLILTLLDAIEQQTFRDFEVIISNDGSTDDTAAVLHANQDQYNYPITVLHNSNGGRAVCRNRGAREAKGEVLVFFDDDIRPNPRCLELHAAFHREHPMAIFNGPALFDMAVVEAKGDFQYYRAKLEMSWYTRNDGPEQKMRAGLVGANKSMPRALFEELGGYNETLTDSEDFELAYRALHQYNYPIYFDYRAWVYHDDYKDFSQYLRRRLEANGSSKRLVERFPEILECYSEKFIFEPTPWKQPFFNIFKSQFFKTFPTTSFFQNYLPRNVRYKLYDIIITANTLYN